MDYHRMNASKHFLTHYANMLTLDWLEGKAGAAGPGGLKARADTRRGRAGKSRLKTTIQLAARLKTLSTMRSI